MSTIAHLFYFINALKANKMVQSGTSCCRVSDGVSCPNCEELKRKKLQ
jgi:hypothetical protein